jgi:hypothetical protein
MAAQLAFSTRDRLEKQEIQAFLAASWYTSNGG